jgi:hypothetical protein
MNRIHLATALALATAFAAADSRPAQSQTTWQIDNHSSIGGHATTVIGDPTVVNTPFGDGMLFDGDDGLIIDDNPVADAPTFTLEMIFRPDPIARPSSSERRATAFRSHRRRPAVARPNISGHAAQPHKVFRGRCLSGAFLKVSSRSVRVLGGPRAVVVCTHELRSCSVLSTTPSPKKTNDTSGVFQFPFVLIHKSTISSRQSCIFSSASVPGVGVSLTSFLTFTTARD